MACIKILYPPHSYPLVASKVASNSFEVLTIQNYNQTFWVAKDQWAPFGQKYERCYDDIWVSFLAGQER